MRSLESPILAVHLQYAYHYIYLFSLRMTFRNDRPIASEQLGLET